MITLPKLNIPLYPHQEYAFAFAMRKKYSINAYEVGHGKSAVAIAIAEANKHLKTLIICPAFLKKNWFEEIRKFAPGNPGILEISASRSIYHDDTYQGGDISERYIILNYEQIKIVHKNLWSKIGFLVCDESQYLGNIHAIRTASLSNSLGRLNTRPERLLLMSGTPIRGKMEQWYAPLHICIHSDNKISSKNFLRSLKKFQNYFMNKRTVSYGGRSHIEYYGAKNIDDLTKIVKDFYLRADPDFRIQLPKLEFKNIMMKDNNEEEELNSFTKSLKRSKLVDAFDEFKLNSKLTDAVSSVKKNNAIKKADFTVQFIFRLLNKGIKKIVVFSDHIGPAEIIVRALRYERIDATLTSSLVSIKTRHQNIVRFQDNSEKGSTVYVSTIGAGSTGITLTASSHLVFNDRSWIQTDNDQAIGRIHRVSQKHDCKIYDILNGEMDKRIKKITENKRLINNSTVEI